MRRLTIIISSLLALAAVAAVTRAGDAPAAAGDLENGITVQGTASVSATPDRATLWIGVESHYFTALFVAPQRALGCVAAGPPPEAVCGPRERAGRSGGPRRARPEDRPRLRFDLPLAGMASRPP